MCRRVACDQWASGAVTRMRWSPGARSVGSSSTSSPTTARIRRRTRFRSTAFPTERGIANAIRAFGAAGSGRDTSRRGPRPRRSPSARRRAKARRPETRSITRTAACGPSGDGRGGRHVPHGCSCGRGSRASCSACARSVDTAASSVPPRAAGWRVVPQAIRLPFVGGETVDVGPHRRVADPARQPHGRGDIAPTLRPAVPARESPLCHSMFHPCNSWPQKAE